MEELMKLQKTKEICSFKELEVENHLLTSECKRLRNQLESLIQELKQSGRFQNDEELTKLRT